MNTTSETWIHCGGCQVTVRDPVGAYLATVRSGGDHGGETIEVEPGGYVNADVRAVPRTWVSAGWPKQRGALSVQCAFCGRHVGARLVTGHPVDHKCPHQRSCEGGDIAPACPDCEKRSGGEKCA